MNFGIFANFACAAAAAIIVMSILLLPLSKVLAEEQVTRGAGELDRFAGYSRVHLSDDTFTLRLGEERVVNFTGISTAESGAYIVGNATVEGGGVRIKITDSHGRCPGVDMCTSISVYSKDAPWSYYDGDVKDVEIPISKGMTQVVFYTPYEQGSTIAFNFDVVEKVVDSKS
jgi:hypothetical protein